MNKTKANAAPSIAQPQPNPLAAALLSWFALVLGHIIVNNQTDKWVSIFLVKLVGFALFCLPGFIVMVLSTLDAYETAQRLKRGESVGPNEYSNGLLYKICRCIDSKATYRGA